MFIIHFSIDDCMEMFKDITVNNYKSVFQSPYFAFLKELNDKYKAHISLFCFIEYANFSLQKTTNKYAKEFTANSDWLKFGFHGYNVDSKYIDQRDNIEKDYNTFSKEIYRITGHKNFCNVLRLHCFSGAKNNLETLYKYGISGLLTSDDKRKSYYLDSNQTHFINKHKIYKDIENGLCFYKSFLRLESFNLADNKTKNLSQHLLLFTHECHLLNTQIQENIHALYQQTIHTHTPNFPNVIHDLELKDFTTDTIKYFFDTYVPITSCNLKCSYCYITQQNLWFKKPPKFDYDAKHIAKCLSKERLGGICMFNMCGGGETLLHPYIIDIMQSILAEGHYIWVVTNGTLTSRYQKIAKLDRNLLFRLAFKFSFHYQELKRTKKLMTFVENVKSVQDLGCSFSIEITPHDELICYIDEIKEFSLKHFGALPHITVARDENNNKAILSKYSTKAEYAKIWSSFNSELFNLKLDLFLKKRREYCMAGKWTYVINIGNGSLYQCYSNNKMQNIFNDKTKPIKLPSVGVKCQEPHCYNGHAFLTLGAIPSLQTPTYALMRNRVQQDEIEWLNPYMKAFMSHKLHENNKKDIFYKRLKGYIHNLMK